MRESDHIVSQAHIPQGIGQALLEHGIYDRETGQLLTGSYNDYAMPRADDMPEFHFETRNIPCVTNALGKRLEATSYREGKVARLVFSGGDVIEPLVISPLR